MSVATSNTNLAKRNYHYSISYKDINITPHSMQRSTERLGINSKDELKKLAGRARNNGINISGLNLHNYERLGLTYPELVAINSHYYKVSNSERMYYYKGYMYCFRGNKAMTLISVLPVHINYNVKMPQFN